MRFSLLPAQAKSMDKGFKYLGFALKPDNYRVTGLGLAHTQGGSQNFTLGSPSPI
jgi:hypothetical protein